ncbi:hypothetical protein ACVXG7_11560 [Enterobacter hormaechei]
MVVCEIGAHQCIRVSIHSILQFTPDGFAEIFQVDLGECLVPGGTTLKRLTPADPISEIRSVHGYVRSPDVRFLQSIVVTKVIDGDGVVNDEVYR